MASEAAAQLTSDFPNGSIANGNGVHRRHHSQHLHQHQCQPRQSTPVSRALSLAPPKSRATGDAAAAVSAAELRRSQSQNRARRDLGHRRMHSCPPAPHQFLPGLGVLPGFAEPTPADSDGRLASASDFPGGQQPSRADAYATSEDASLDASATDSELAVVAEGNESLVQCGWFCYRPACLQPLARPLPFLFSVIGLYFVQSFIVSGYINSINTTIELRYGLTTKEIGYIYASYEVTCIVATFFISYFGHGCNRSRLLGIGCAVLGAGFFFFAFPHFLGSAISNAVPTANATSTGTSSSSAARLCGNTTGAASTDLDCRVQDYALLILCLSFGLMGLGASPVYILAPTYLWDNVPQRSYPLYAASLHITSALGPACGFLGGAVFLSLYVNFPASAPAGMTTSHPLWTGAWWLGFIIFAGLALLVAAPLMAFPTVMPPRRSRRKQLQQPEMVRSPSAANSEATIVSASGSSSVEESSRPPEPPTPPQEPPVQPHIRDIPAGLKRLFANALWLFISLLIVAEQSVVQAFVAYVNKYMQKSFGIPVTQSSIVTGALVIPSAVIGIASGALVMRRFRPSNRTVSLLMMALCLSTTLLTIGLAFSTCPNVRMAGLTASYGIPANDSTSTFAYAAGAQLQLNVTCNRDCGCGSLNYDPACDTLTGVTYYTPCHAGCRGRQSLSEDSWNYTDCTCVGRAANASAPGGSLVSGKCDVACATFAPFCALLFVIVLLTACGYEPSHILTLSCVSERDSSFALGMQNILQRLLAFIPAPIYFGSLFDSTCLMWSSDSACSSGSGTTACMEYDLSRLPYMWIGVILALKVVGFLFATACFLVSRASRAVNLAEATPAITADAVGALAEPQLQSAKPA